MRFFFLIFFLLSFPLVGEAQKKKPRLHRTRSSVIPRSLLKTKGAVLAQNVILDEAGILRVKRRSQVESFVKTGALVSLPKNLVGITFDPIPNWQKFVLPETAEWMKLTSSTIGKKLHHPLIITSGLRDESKQRVLKKKLGKEAASAELSVHLAGAAVDFSKRNLSRKDLKIFLTWLDHEEKAHRIDALFHGRGRKHFHVFILPKTESRVVNIPVFRPPTINIKLRPPSSIDALAP